jgi:hypothetical protein
LTILLGIILITLGGGLDFLIKPLNFRGFKGNLIGKESDFPLILNDFVLIDLNFVYNLSNLGLELPDLADISIHSLKANSCKLTLNLTLILLEG